MDRLSIINKFIKERNYKSFLNIGVFTGFTLDGVECEKKEGVDPQPEHYKGKEKVHGVTSDEFFSYPWLKPQVPGETKNLTWDVIFIDGLHEYHTVYRDIMNSLNHLSEGGVILLHDLNPPTLEHVTTGDKHGNWNGDCYKAFLEFQAQDPFGKYITFCIDTDWGVGVIEKSHIPIERMGIHNYNRGINDWEYFDKNRKELLNLISVGDFTVRFLKEKWKQEDKIALDNFPVSEMYIMGCDPYKTSNEESLGEITIFKDGKPIN